MNYDEACIAMTEGKRVRRAIWHKHNHVIAHNKVLYSRHRPNWPKSRDHERDFPLTQKDIEATDWELYVE